MPLLSPRAYLQPNPQLPSESSLIHDQDIPLHDIRRVPNAPLPLRHPRPNKPAPTPPRHRRPRNLHPLRSLADRPHRNLHSALRSQRVRKLLLQCISTEYRAKPGDAGVAGNERVVYGLEGGVCFLDRGDGFLAVDDGYGVAGQQG